MDTNRWTRMTTAALEQAGRATMSATAWVEQLRAPLAPREPEAALRCGRGPVLVVGGFAATDPVMAPLAARLHDLGYDVASSTAGAGLGCAGDASDALADRLIEVADRAGRPVQVVGHSRGGQFARVAARRADVVDGGHVAGLVTLGTPFDLYGLGWSVMAQAAAVSAAGSLGAPGLATLGCLWGPCCAGFRSGLRAPWPGQVPFTSIYSRRDRAVRWTASIDPHARNVEVGGQHLGLLTSPAAVAAVSEALADTVEGSEPAVAADRRLSA